MTKLDDTRAALHAALVLAMADCGWPGRAEPTVPDQARPPVGWVDVPTMHQAPTERARAVALTFPVFVAFDGSQRAQVALLDAMLAHGWQRLSAAGTQYQTIVQSAGPEDVDVGGTVVRALMFRVQTTVQTQTLCPQTLAQTTTEESN